MAVSVWVLNQQQRKSQALKRVVQCGSEHAGQVRREHSAGLGEMAREEIKTGGPVNSVRFLSALLSPHQVGCQHLNVCEVRSVLLCS